MAFLFISPLYPSNSVSLCRQIRACGVEVYGLVDSWPAENLDVCNHLEYVDLMNENQVFDVVDRLQKERGVQFHWVEAFSDYWLELEARLRQHLGLRYTMCGPDFERQLTKSGAKPYYAKAHVPTADYVVTQDPEEVRRFAARVGYPLIAKPDRGSGASQTFKLDDAGELAAFVATGQLAEAPFIFEEFIAGELVSYDGLCDLDGRIVFESVGNFRVPCLDLAVSGSSIDCAASVLHRPDPAVVEAGRACALGFGIRGRFFHMEFFVCQGDRKVVGLEVNMRAQPLFFPIWDVVFGIDVVSLYIDMLRGRSVCVPPSPAVPQQALFFSRRQRHQYRMSHQQIMADPCVFAYTPVTASTLMGDSLYYLSDPQPAALYEKLVSFLSRV